MVRGDLAPDFSELLQLALARVCLVWHQSRVLASRDFTKNDRTFLAAWQEWFDRFADGPDDIAPLGTIPRLAEASSFQDKLAKGHEFSLEVLCRPD